MRNKAGRRCGRCSGGASGRGSGVAVDILAPGATVQHSAWCQGTQGKSKPSSPFRRGSGDVFYSSQQPAPLRPRPAHESHTAMPRELRDTLKPVLFRRHCRNVQLPGREGKKKGLSVVAVTLSLAEAARSCRVAITKWHAPWRIRDPMQGGPPLKWEAQRDMSGDRTPCVARRPAVRARLEKQFLTACTPAHLHTCKPPANVGPLGGGGHTQAHTMKR